MTISSVKPHFICLIAIGFALAACSEIPSETMVISPPETVCPEPTRDSESVTSQPIGVESTPTPTEQLTVAAATPMLGSVRVIQITEQDKIAGVRWSADGQSVVYATWGRHRGEIEEWWEYRVSTGERHLIQSPLSLDPQIWTQLEASNVDEAFLWFNGGLSPSGTRVVYNRLPPGYSSTPTPDDFSYPIDEAWTARSDGSGAMKLQCNCNYIAQASWLDQEKKVLLSCSEEGGGGEYLADVDGSSCVDILGGLTVSHWTALSPDEKKLAFPDALGVLQIAFLDSGEVRPIAQWGYMPNWSPDSHRLYYQYTQEFNDRLADIRVYDLDTGVDTLLIPSPEHALDGMGVSIPIGTFAVSPLENAAVFENLGLWLVRWSP